MINERDILIRNSIMALYAISREAGFDNISRQTLVVIMETYARMYGSPIYPGKTQAPTTYTGIPIPTPTPLPDNVINMFGGRPPKVTPLKETRGDLDFVEARRAHNETERRLKAQRTEDNEDIIGPFGPR